jgi:hypothetical protein
MSAFGSLWLATGVAAGFALFTSSIAHAQVTAQGYGVIGSGRYTNRLPSGRGDTLTTSGNTGVVSAGVEALVGGRFGVSAEAGFQGYGSTVTVDGLFELRQARQRVAPFLRAGFTHDTGEYSNAYNGPNVGGGVNVWLHPHAGLRVEYLHIAQSLAGASGWTEDRDLVRVGVSFR